MIVFSPNVHRRLYFSGLVLLAVALPTSVFLTSIAEIILIVNWLMEMPFFSRWNKLKGNHAVLILCIFYLIHLAGMVYTSDYEWGFHDLRIKLPMLILPVIIGTSWTTDQKMMKVILNFFIASLVICTVWQFLHYVGHQNPAIRSLAEVDMPVDHIRFSLMLNLAIFSMFWLINHEKSFFRWIYIPLIIWFLIIIGLLQSLTGYIVLFLVSGILFFRMAYLSKNIVLRVTIGVGIIIVLLLSISFASRTYRNFFSFRTINLSGLDSMTSENHPYQHTLSEKMVENGQYVYLYVCEPELRQEWNKRSKVSYDGREAKGYSLKYTLFRYMTSRGLRKDAAGLRMLSDDDIRHVEMGMTNYIFTEKYSIYPRFYTLMWELNEYKTRKNPTGFSYSQRLMALSIAIEIIKENPWIGIGTGDVRYAFAKRYETNQREVAMPNRIRAHNQWVTFVITFGIVGTLGIAFSLFYPIFLENKISNYLFLIILFIGLLSFLDEDTLETHTAISFFALFYSLFLFGLKEKPQKCELHGTDNQ